MDAVIERLARSPQLGLYAERIQEILAQEQAAREHFYEVVGEEEKAEFINGEIIVHSPVKMGHNLFSFQLAHLLKAYVQMHGLGYVGHEKIMISLTRNDYEPDICFFGREKARAFTLELIHFPAPDLVVEVLSESTAVPDRGVKFEDYAAHGVGEYWIVDPERQIVEQYELEGDAYALRLKLNSGELESTLVSGFKIPVRAIFDEAENLAALRQILAAG